MKLTDRQLASGASLTDLLHIVIPSDKSQNPNGSSYKIEMGTYASLFSTPTYWINGSSGLYSLKANNNSGLNAIGNYSIAEGYNTHANGDYSHAEGRQTTALGVSSHAGGSGTTANGYASFIHGNNSVVNGNYSIVLGRNLTGNTADTTYVDNLNIRTVPIGTPINNLGIDVNGRVVAGTSTDLHVTGMTFNTGNYNLSVQRNDGVTFTQSLGILASDMNVTGGTYNSSTGIATFTNNSGGTFQVTGFVTGMTDTYTTGGTYNQTTGIATFTNNLGGTFQVTGFLTPNKQKIITTSYSLLSDDNDYTIIINNGSNPINITIPSGLPYAINIGFIQQGTGDVTFITSGTTIKTPLVGAFKIKGENYNAYLEQVASSNVYHLLGNLKV